MRELVTARACYRALVVHSPGAELAGINMEAKADVEAEADAIRLAARRMNRAQALGQIAAGHRPERDEVDRLHEAMRAFLRAAGALVEDRIAIHRDRLDWTDLRNNLVADEPQRLHDV